MRQETRRNRAAAWMVAAGVIALPAQAGNGLNVTATGADALAMGGADIAVPGSTVAVTTNPANLAAIPGSRFDFSAEPFITHGFKHRDALNKTRLSGQPYGVLLNSSYATRLWRPDLSLGVGLFVAGGAGAEYKDLATVFGTRDDYSVTFGVTRLATGLGWQASEQLNVGASVNVVYASLRQKLYPETSVAEAGFYGLRLDGADGASFGGRIGATWKASPTLTLAATFAPKTKLRLEGGVLSVNYSALEQGVVRYGEARAKGFALPQELGVALAWQATPSWLWSTELTWLDWSRALSRSRLTARDPETPNAAVPQTVELEQALDFRDQLVLAIGTRYALSDRTRLMAGINLARNPVPGSTLTPTLNVTQEFEIDVGIRHDFSDRWSFASTFQFQPAKTESGDNPAQPFTSAREGYGVIGLVFEMTRRW